MAKSPQETPPFPLPIIKDIEETFGYRDDATYQSRAHAYLERYEVNRGYNDTAVQAVVEDLCFRAFEAGCKSVRPEMPKAAQAALAQASAACLSALAELEEGCNGKA